MIFGQRLAEAFLRQQHAGGLLTASAEAGSGKLPMAATSAKVSPGPTMCSTCSLPPGPVLNTRTSPWPTTKRRGRRRFRGKPPVPCETGRAGRWWPAAGTPPRLDLREQRGSRARMSTTFTRLDPVKGGGRRRVRFHCKRQLPELQPVPGLPASDDCQDDPGPICTPASNLTKGDDRHVLLSMRTNRQGDRLHVFGVCGKDPTTAALQDLLVYATKGISMYAHRAAELGARDRQIDRAVLEFLFATVTNVDFDPERLQRPSARRRQDPRQGQGAVRSGLRQGRQDARDARRARRLAARRRSGRPGPAGRGGVAHQAAGAAGQRRDRACRN